MNPNLSRNNWNGYVKSLRQKYLRSGITECLGAVAPPSPSFEVSFFDVCSFKRKNKACGNVGKLPAFPHFHEPPQLLAITVI